MKLIGALTALSASLIWAGPASADDLAGMTLDELRSSIVETVEVGSVFGNHRPLGDCIVMSWHHSERLLWPSQIPYDDRDRIGMHRPGGLPWRIPLVVVNLDCS